MTTLIRERPLNFELKPKSDIMEQEPSDAFFEFKVYFPEDRMIYSEMTDQEVVIAASESGTFHFLDNVDEDIYST